MQAQDERICAARRAIEASGSVDHDRNARLFRERIPCTHIDRRAKGSDRHNGRDGTFDRG